MSNNVIKMWAGMFACTVVLGAGMGFYDKVNQSAGVAALSRLANGEAGQGEPAGSISDAGLSLVEDGGALVVSSVKAGSLAERSGFKAGDRISAVNRNVVHTLAQLTEYYKGQGSTFNVKRNGTSVYPNIEMGKAPPIANMLPSGPAAPVVGLEVMDMVGMYPAGIHAPMTMNPAPGGLAEKAGIKAEQWLTAVNGKSIATAAEYRQLAAGDGPLSVTIVDVSSNPRQTREVKLR